MSQSNKRVAVIGTVGVPARYGGFETLVENMLGDNCSPEVHYTVYCSSKAYKERLKTYKGARLRYVPLKANGAQSIPYDMISIFRALFSKDRILLILGVSGAIILPFVRLVSRKKLIVNIDGLEHRRDKWSPRVRRFLKWSEQIAVRNAHVVISDNKAIQDYVRAEYGKESALIAYGGDHALGSTPDKEPNEPYAFSLCRIEPENNVHLTLEAFQQTPDKRLIFIGNWQNSDYGKQLFNQYDQCPNIELLDPIYDIDTLNSYRSAAGLYIHGHSAGGTNPSLVEAMFFDASILCFDVPYNRETTENNASYYQNIEQLKELLSDGASNHEAMNQIARRRYVWSVVAKQYKELY